MGRLIESDKLKADLEKAILENGDMDCLDFLKIASLINAQPTAYDVDAVVEQLEKNGQKMSEAKSNKLYGKSTSGCHNYYKAISVKRAIEIAKGGGVDAN